MKRVFSFFMYLILFLLVGGCASVKFYSGPGLTGKTGLRYYTVKPYLLVEFNAEKDNTVKTTVVYLPDLASPQYISLKPGIGSNELKLAFTNSSLATYGLVSESQIPETINAIAGLVSKGSDAVSQLSKQGQVPSAGVFKLYEIVITSTGTSLREVAGDN